MLRTKSRGLDTNILELKTWIFGPTGATVVNIRREVQHLVSQQFCILDHGNCDRGRKAEDICEAVHGES